jgi:hypothetical protein
MSAAAQCSKLLRPSLVNVTILFEICEVPAWQSGPLYRNGTCVLIFKLSILTAFLNSVVPPMPYAKSMTNSIPQRPPPPLFPPTISSDHYAGKPNCYLARGYGPCHRHQPQRCFATFTILHFRPTPLPSQPQTSTSLRTENKPDIPRRRTCPTVMDSHVRGHLPMKTP